MKKILITGANSYIGTSFEKWVSQYPEQYKVDTLDLIESTWREQSFQGYDVIYHVAGIAHIKQTEENKDLYYKVNRDLAVEVATKAKKEGIKQFIFLSSMSVYGVDEGIITCKTIPNPKCHYGKSKYEAEKKILELDNQGFNIVILRPPMVYGKGCKGNYIKLHKLVKKSPFFPKINNERSMIYIDNLNCCVKIIIDTQKKGLFCPQNSSYVCTSEMIKIIGNNYNKSIILVPGLQFIIKILSKKIKILSKVFGNLIYDYNLSDVGDSYQVVDFNNSIKCED